MATTAFSALSAPHDDTMEMSSPGASGPRNYDDDIEIDFDEDYDPSGGGGVYLPPSDERMLEDDEDNPQSTLQPRPGTATTDEMMGDGDDAAAAAAVAAALPAVPEQVMQEDDGPQALEQDEELLDYGDEEDVGGDAGVQITDFQTGEGMPQVDVAAAAAPAGGVDVVEVNQPGQPQPAGNVLTVAEGLAQEILEEHAEAPLPESALGLDLLPSSAGEGTTTQNTGEEHDQAQDFGNEHDNEIEQVSTEEHPEEQVTFDDPEAVAGPSTADTNAPAQEHPELEAAAIPASPKGPATPTDTGLHPMVVRYGDMTMPLFKSHHQQDGLLKDDNLASLSLAELILNCRQRLALKIGEDISEDQELVLGFDQLGLMLVEDSRPAFETSLNEIVEIYVQLHTNDQSQDVPPLSLAISLQLKFTSTLATLKQAAAGGHGISSFAFLAGNAAGEEEYFEVPYEEYNAEQENAEGETFTANGEEAEGYENQYEADAQHGEDEDHEHGEEEHDEFHGEEYYHSEEEHPVDEEHADGQHDHEEGQEEAQNGEEEQLASDSNTAHGDGNLGNEQRAKPASPASSATIRNDDVQGLAEATENRYDDYSTFVQHAGEDDGLHPNQYPEDQATTGDVAQDSTTVEAQEATGDVLEDQHFASGDLLEDFDELPADSNHQYDDPSHHQHDENGDAQDDNLYDDTDNYGTQQEDVIDGEHFGDGTVLENDGAHEAAEEDSAELHNEDAANATVESVTVAGSEKPHEDDTIDFEDDIGFDDDNEGDGPSTPHDAVQKAASSDSPLGKRSFDEHADANLYEDEPEPKKARAS